MERRPNKPMSPNSQPDGAESESIDEPEKATTSTLSPSMEKEALSAPLLEEDAPPLPDEQPPPFPDEAPPLPQEAPPAKQDDDGWEPVWDDRVPGFYFFNRFTNKTQWENPRVPEAAQPTPGPPGVSNHVSESNNEPPPAMGGYNPAVHGDYDPDADYAKADPTSTNSADFAGPPGTEGTPADPYAATGAFNRFTGKWQNADFTTDRFSDEQKSKRQMNAFFDVDAAANSHDGRSLRAERANKKLSKNELKAFKEKRREKKEEKRRAWLRD